MTGVVKNLLLRVALGMVPILDRTKSGTSALRLNERAPQFLKWEEPALAGSLNAERAGNYLALDASFASSSS
jgi:hypothetical protein